MNRMEQGIASIPRQTVIREQPHMLAYITPAEAMLLKQNGGSGLPSHGGVPEFGAVNDFFSGFTSDLNSLGSALSGGSGGNTGRGRSDGPGSETFGSEARQAGDDKFRTVQYSGNGVEAGTLTSSATGPRNFFDSNQNKPIEGWAAYHGGIGSAANTSDNDGAMSQGRYAAQPMYQAPMPASFAPPTMTPISSGQPTNAGAVPIVDPELPNNPMPVGPNMPIGQRPANKAYTFQELLGMYQNPYA